MKRYYSDNLAAERLKQVYEIAPPRVRQYLKAEVDHLLRNIRPGDTVLELGCGYGRILPRLAQKAGRIIGIDTSLGSLFLGREMLSGISNCLLLQMDAQSAAGFLGEIDLEKTRDGVIVCKDGFIATTVRPHQFLSLTAECNVDTRIVEVDESSLFCEMIPHGTGNT
ncbi:MAG: class I SAM-dependent methyltransferase [bacterium]